MRMRALLLLLCSVAMAFGQTFGNSVAFLGASVPKVAGMAVPPVSGYMLWLAPEGDVFTDLNGVTQAVSLASVNRWNDLSGNGNHVYRTNTTASQPEGGHFDSAYTLNGKRIMQFGRNCAAGGLANKTGMVTSNAVPMTGGFTLFYVASFLPPCSAAEVGGVFFGYKDFELLARQNPSGAIQMKTYKNNSGVELTDPVTIGVSNYQFYCWTFSDADNTTAFYRSNNLVASSADAGATPASGEITVGYWRNDGINSHVNGGLTELIFYTNTLTVLQISNVNVYLKEKYGL